MVRKCATPGTDHFSSLRWPNTSMICVQIRVPTSSVRPVTGWPESVSLASHSTRRTASKAMIAVMPKPTTSLISICVCTEHLPKNRVTGQ